MDNSRLSLSWLVSLKQKKTFGYICPGGGILFENISRRIILF